MESLFGRVESWIKEQKAKMALVWPPPTLLAPPKWHWPRWPTWKAEQDRREQDRLLRLEYEKQQRQLQDLCQAVKADSVADLQEILCSMVLAECVYKRPEAELIRSINKFKDDFGGQLISLERMQHSLDREPHRSSATKFKEELQKGTHDLNETTDLVVLVHNFSQWIDRHQQSSHSSSQPALSALLTITNKFSTSAQKQKMLVKSSMEAYGAPPNMIEVINSCPSVVPTVTSCIHAPSPPYSSSMGRLHAQKIILAPINLARIPFQRKDVIVPIEGVASFWKLVHHVLRSHEMSFQVRITFKHNYLRIH
ncbi:hypothetical protein KSP40_PGU000558 [Platanthera guangdongensis]|uniref:Uncharacterized protein n=1 Tax=Platanthera guangdongensis TaxID=2320717 RepID=A0ABR2LYR5_9ASPA